MIFGRPGVEKVESAGSCWWFDMFKGEYLRLPRNEAPREHPEWGNVEAGPLQDGVWHTFGYYAIEDGRLWIYGMDDRLMASAPMPRVTA